MVTPNIVPFPRRSKHHAAPAVYPRDPSVRIGFLTYLRNVERLLGRKVDEPEGAIVVDCFLSDIPPIVIVEFIQPLGL
jgi:hypothetical protein